MADPWRMLVVCLTILLAGQPASAQSVSFPSVTVGSSQAGPEVNGWIYKPPGEGPFLVIVLAHRCAGTNRHADVWGKLVVSWRYVVLAPDSFFAKYLRKALHVPTNNLILRRPRSGRLEGWERAPGLWGPSFETRTMRAQDEVVHIYE